MHTRNKTYAGLAILTIAILAGSLAYYYSVASAEIASLKSDGKALCSTIGGAVNSLLVLTANITLTMQQQIKEDDSMIAVLNSTRPPGYTNMTATLQGEIRQDTYVTDSINSMITSTSFLTGLGNGPCTPFY